jgi:hypothetical protein
MVDEKERDLIRRRMEQSGIRSLRAYMLKMAADGRVIRVELDSVKEMVRLLSNATSNINQIARRANETGSIHAAGVADLRRQCDGLWGQAKEILRRLADI